MTDLQVCNSKTWCSYVNSHNERTQKKQYLSKIMLFFVWKSQENKHGIRQGGRVIHASHYVQNSLFALNVKFYPFVVLILFVVPHQIFNVLGVFVYTCLLYTSKQVQSTSSFLATETFFLENLFVMCCQSEQGLYIHH